MMQPNEPAKTVLDSVRYIAVATVSDAGEPWNTVVAAYHFPDDYTLYWASWLDNQHSKNIRANGRAFIVAFDSTPANGTPSAGVFILAEVTELTDEVAVLQAAEVFGNDPFNPSDGREYLGGKPRRIYKAVPVQIWMNSDSAINGDFIDIREDAATP